MQLHVFDESLNLKGIIDRYQKATWVRRFSRPGSLQLEVNRNATAADLLALRTFVALDDDSDGVIDHAYLIEQKELGLDAAGRSSELIEVRGRDVTGLLAERLSVPPPGLSHDAQTNVAAETSMKHYVDRHAVSPVDVDRKIPNLVMAADQGRGALDDEAGRYHPISDLLERISLRTDMGFEVTFDPASKDHVFDVVSGIDRTASVFLDADFDTVRQQRWLASDLSRRTFAIVAGQGEGAARTIVQTFLGAAQPTGLDRRELFVDARDTNDTAALTDRGKAKLKETESQDSFQTDVAQFGSFRYREHFDLGDLVTVRNVRWGVEQAARIVTVTSEMTPATGLRDIKVELGRPLPTLRDRVAPSGLDGSARA